jgi:hypothetical protein
MHSRAAASATKSICRFFQGVTKIDFYLSRSANPSPLPNKGPCTEQIGLHIKEIVAVLVSLGILLLEFGECRGHDG